jgi:hypothetical protein
LCDQCGLAKANRCGDEGQVAIVRAVDKEWSSLDRGFGRKCRGLKNDKLVRQARMMAELSNVDSYSMLLNACWQRISPSGSVLILNPSRTASPVARFVGVRYLPQP